MILDMRYHIASLVAVFLALGIGILIGSAVLGERALVQQQAHLIDRLEADLQKVTGEKRELTKEAGGLKEEVRSADRFSRSVMPLLVADRLYGKQVAIIKTGNGVESKVVDDLSRVLKLSGAEVVSTTSVLQDLGALDTEKRESVAKILGVGDPASEGLPSEIAKGLGREIAKGIPTLATSFLADSQVVAVNGRYRTQVDVVVVLGGSQDETKQSWKSLDLPLIDALKQAGVEVAAVEPVSTKVSYIRHYKTKGILTVDNIDSVPGQVALVYGLAADKRGAYGVKETARQLLPATESLAP